jgi:hypothetical protein
MLIVMFQSMQKGVQDNPETLLVGKEYAKDVDYGRETGKIN